MSKVVGPLVKRVEGKSNISDGGGVEDSIRPTERSRPSLHLESCRCGFSVHDIRDEDCIYM